ncbi:MAG: 1-acyl-sn-glycerol-3-phosphate acyltransferase [Neisseriaceae bacterium]|nr:1-acyl-sn-glycerol-3-phosphate acyltransferase [Neisseriaceae bacterium]
MNILKKIAVIIISSILGALVSLMTGVRTKRNSEMPLLAEKMVFYANHNSHGDFMLIWSSLPKRWRQKVRPVAGADYWLKGPIRRLISQDVFHALLITRNSGNPTQAIEDMSKALQNGDHLMIFPEGTRNTTDEILQPFKSGIYHLASMQPETVFVPIWLSNIKHVLPKGHILPVPLICEVHIGQGIQLQENEERDAFLQRTRDALLSLSQHSSEYNEHHHD